MTFTWLTVIGVDQVTVKVRLIVVQGQALFTLQNKKAGEQLWQIMMPFCMCDQQNAYELAGMKKLRL